MSGILLSAVLVLTNSIGSVSVDTLGARVVSYRPSDGVERLVMLSSGTGGYPVGCEADAEHSRAMESRVPGEGDAAFRFMRRP